MDRPVPADIGPLPGHAFGSSASAPPAGRRAWLPSGGGREARPRPVRPMRGTHGRISRAFDRSNAAAEGAPDAKRSQAVGIAIAASDGALAVGFRASRWVPKGAPGQVCARFSIFFRELMERSRLAKRTGRRRGSERRIRGHEPSREIGSRSRPKPAMPPCAAPSRRTIGGVIANVFVKIVAGGMLESRDRSTRGQLENSA